ncbi:MAG: T9SS type A sorting domain-containing protein [Chitinophagales bacterium]|nr:T9SS type A sorting domain-containing protein [Chitinophagales bacterium]MCB9020240.1 T9SS type A sorting domain-containing protein [Chitinophagales bacterium]MCB9022225.1 T9SS type A sorting domain-containing protein [Chitinophagales bacterium]HAE12648.1 hypothetical protein [Bacteroidota bacterium]HPE98010.1 T9SS type A sorting domain-containing protein [Chitinophagales bacterium]
MRRYILIFVLFMPIFSMAQTAIHGVINDYTIATGIGCDNKLEVTDAAAFSPGDKVLIVQMKGAVIDSSNTSSFGTILNWGTAGKYELNELADVGDDHLQLAYLTENTYDFSFRVQVVRVPVYDDVLVDSVLTCPAWDGETGGILALIVNGTLTLEADMDVSEKGYRGGEFTNFPDSCPFGFSWNGYYTTTTSGNGAIKGEGFTSVSDARRAGRGKLANGGGGGNDHNAGGGGGTLGGEGGEGGERDVDLFSCPGPGTGRPGVLPDHSNAENRIWLGGGGGAGHGNNGFAKAGGHGGGIIFLQVNSLDGNGFSIRSNGGSPASANGDGGGGGGAGGSLLLDVSTLSSDVLVELKGGNGSNITGNACTGPGGGGGGGLVRHTGASLPAGFLTDYGGGAAGITTTASSPCFNETNGATDGATGQTIADWPLLEADIPYVPLMATISNDTTICAGNIVELTAGGGTTFSWSPPDYLSATDIAEPTCFPDASVTYTVIVGNGTACFDTVSVSVEVEPGLTVVAGPDTTLCGANQIQFFASGGDTYTWSPGTGVSNVNIADPIVFVSTTTDYVVTASNGTCTGTDTVSVIIYANPEVVTLNDTTICLGESLDIFADGALYYNWFPETAVPCTDCSSMSISPTENVSLSVTGTNAVGCTSTQSFTVTVEVCQSVADNWPANWNLYPNPAADHITLETGSAAGLKQLILMDANGRNVRNWSVTGQTTQLSLSGLPAGNYLLIIQEDDHRFSNNIIKYQ